jgi:hypothetical protein
MSLEPFTIVAEDLAQVIAVIKLQQLYFHLLFILAFIFY